MSIFPKLIVSSPSFNIEIHVKEDMGKNSSSPNEGSIRVEDSEMSIDAIEEALFKAGTENQNCNVDNLLQLYRRICASHNPRREQQKIEILTLALQALKTKTVLSDQNNSLLSLFAKHARDLPESLEKANILALFAPSLNPIDHAIFYSSMAESIFLKSPLSPSQELEKIKNRINLAYFLSERHMNGFPSSLDNFCPGILFAENTNELSVSTSLSRSCEMFFENTKNLKSEDLVLRAKNLTTLASCLSSFSHARIEGPENALEEAIQLGTLAETLFSSLEKRLTLSDQLRRSMNLINLASCLNIANREDPSIAFSHCRKSGDILSDLEKKGELSPKDEIYKVKTLRTLCFCHLRGDLKNISKAVECHNISEILVAKMKFSLPLQVERAAYFSNFASLIWQPKSNNEVPTNLKKAIALRRRAEELYQELGNKIPFLNQIERAENLTFLALYLVQEDAPQPGMGEESNVCQAIQLRRNSEAFLHQNQEFLSMEALLLRSTNLIALTGLIASPDKPLSKNELIEVIQYRDQAESICSEIPACPHSLFYRANNLTLLAFYLMEPGVPKNLLNQSNIDKAIECCMRAERYYLEEKDFLSPKDRMDRITNLSNYVDYIILQENLKSGPKILGNSLKEKTVTAVTTTSQLIEKLFAAERILSLKNEIRRARNLIKLATYSPLPTQREEFAHEKQMNWKKLIAWRELAEKIYFTLQKQLSPLDRTDQIENLTNLSHAYQSLSRYSEREKHLRIASIYMKGVEYLQKKYWAKK
ncbi:MAG: hypothetical protein V4487_08915 [Chlamydiota bacterium]